MADTERMVELHGPGRREAEVLRLVREHVHASYVPGQLLEPVADIARHLGLPHNAVRQAIRTLDGLGELAICRPRIRIVLGPGQVHPRDAPLIDAVRARIRTGRYARGQALPTGLLGEEFALRPEHVDRACGHLLNDGALRKDAAGPYGPAYYVL
ncbi:hypothetical protein ACTVZO_38610 [Streptomyces sp. IBSNAI002]|uniref:hypothetical protein n=1 Tax=Streptomyces sp. IBSNAI002 TaxID=3457500 RepID=UPI003FD4EEE5